MPGVAASGLPPGWSLTAPALEAKLQGPRPRLHDLRHSFASALIAAGADVVFVSRQLGHANPQVALQVYSHEFAKAAHEERFRAAVEETSGPPFRLTTG